MGGARSGTDGGGGGGGPAKVVRSGVFRVLVIGNRVGGLLSPLPGICNDFLIRDSLWFAALGDRRPPTIGTLARLLHPRGTELAATRGLTVSQRCCILVSSRKHHRSVCGTDRTGAEIMLPEPTPRRGWQDAFGNRGGGGRGWARRRHPVRRFSRSRAPGVCPAGWSARSEYPQLIPE